jgi:hypothetical protein
MPDHRPGGLVKDFLTEETLQAIVRGQLKTTIHAHGPIQGAFIGSAARRIANDILGHLRNMSLEDLSNASAALEVERLRKELKEKNDLFRKKQAEIMDLLERMKDATWPCSKCGKAHGLGNCPE